VDMVNTSYFSERRAARVPLPQHGFPSKSIRKKGLFWVVLFSDVAMLMKGGNSFDGLYGTMLQTDRAALYEGKRERKAKVSGGMNEG